MGYLLSPPRYILEILRGNKTNKVRVEKEMEKRVHVMKDKEDMKRSN